MSGRIRRVAILGHRRRPGVRRAAAALRARLARRRIEVRIEEALATALGVEGHSLGALASWCELLVTLGGDGTVLSGARALAGKRGALLPVNLGGLGFLTVADGRGLAAAVNAVLAGRWPVARRRVVTAAIRRRGRQVRTGVAMNDVVIKGAGGYAALHLEVSALGSDVGHLVADGLIAASAAGSTAYSLSAGGPVLAPELDALVLTPACPHSLGSRSLVLPAGAEVEVRLLGSSDHCLVLFDGQDAADLETGDQVRMRLDRMVVRVYQNPARPFMRSLQTKLGWQGSEQRSL